jgi:restriction system protein
MARRQGFFDDLLSIGLKLPWRVGVAAAVVIFVALHVVAIYTQAPVSAKSLADVGVVVQHGFIHVFAKFLQYVIPAGLLIGTTVGYFKQRQSRAMFVAAQANPKPAITSMSWRDFERLVGEVFRRQGFVVSGFGGQGPDGGVDLGLSKNGQRYLVQCKHWRKRQVPVTVVRELNGVVSAQGAHGGFVVTGGEFSREAREFAESCGIKLIDRPALAKLIGDTRNAIATGRGNGVEGERPRIREASRSHAFDSPLPGEGRSPNSLADGKVPACPRCGLSMIERKATQGKFAGKPFWGCQQYPKCSGIVAFPRLRCF